MELVNQKEKQSLNGMQVLKGIIAPEIIKILEGEYYDDECDLWSLGIII